MPASIAKLESLVLDLKKENTALRTELADRDKDILQLKNHVNSMDQYNRSWSIRIFNLPIPAADASNNFKVAKFVYDNVLLPILIGAVDEGDLTEIPSCQQLLERAHILPSQGGKPVFVICHFIFRDHRSLIFKHKKKYQPREAAQPLSNRKTSKNQPILGRFLYPIHEDLTRPTMNKMRALAAHPDVNSAWTTHGIIRFKCNDDSHVYRVESVFDSVENILSRVASKKAG